MTRRSAPRAVEDEPDAIARPDAGAPRRARRPAVVAVAVALVAAGWGAACSSNDQARPAPPVHATGARYAGERFYRPPDPLPAGDHGTLIRYQRAPSVAGTSTYRIMYLSESLRGERIAVTGLVMVPSEPAPRGGRPVVSEGHGTTGLVDRCAPSKDGPVPSTWATDDRMLVTPAPPGDDYVVVVSDYEGLGTPGPHPYLIGESEGRSVLDAARAARQVPGADADRRVGIAGYSQGGQAALWAGSLAPRWTPELDVVGVFAGAPPADLTSVARHSDRTAPFLIMAIESYARAFDADPAKILGPRGMEALRSAGKGCVLDVFESTARALDDRPLFKADPTTVEPWASLFEQSADLDRSPSPVLIVHSSTDGLSPLEASEVPFRRLCRKGQVIERVTPDLGPHQDAFAPAFAMGFDWLRARFRGEPARSNCPR